MTKIAENFLNLEGLPSHLSCWAHQQIFRLSHLIGRISTNWKELFLISSTAVAVIAAVGAFFSGSILYGIAFGVLGTACYFGYQYAKEYYLLSGIEHQVGLLQSANRSLGKLSGALQEENDQFRKNNLELSENNEKLKGIAQALQEQTVSLQLSLAQLRSSSEAMRQQVDRFVRENAHLGAHVSGFDSILKRLDGELLLSKSLCEQVQQRLAVQSEDLAGKLKEIGALLSDLKAENRTLEKMRELSYLQQEIMIASGQLKILQTEYANERIRLQDVRKALEQERVQFEALRKEFAAAFSSNVHELAAERAKLQQLFERVSVFLTTTRYPHVSPMITAY
jgi:chromosome segregation ATPase